MGIKSDQQGASVVGHFSLADDAMEAQFRACALPPKWFTHEAHLRLAWIHLRKYGREIAIQNICNQLQQFVRFLGAEEKYNATLTVAAVHAVHHFMQRSEAATFVAFIATFPRLKTHFKELMGMHYAHDLLHSPAAKATYIAPDLMPFDQ